MNGINPHEPGWAIWLQSPIGEVFFPTIMSLLIISIIACVRWLMAKGAWMYHPRGASGYLVDEILRYSLFFMPFVIIGVGIRVYFFVLHPEMKNTPTMYACFMLILVARLVVRRLPIAKSVARHIDAAQAQYRAAKAETPA